MTAGGPCYLYGIVRAGAVDGLPTMTGVGARPVRTVVAGPLAALVSELDTLELQATKADLLAHSEVLQAVVDRGDVVPFSFGHLFHDAGQVRRDLLEHDAVALERVLDELQGTVEVQCKATYVEATVVADIVQSDRRMQRLRGSPDHGRQLELGRRFADALEARRRRDSTRLLDRLGRMAVRSSPGDPPGKFGVVSAAFLVDRTTVPSFLEAVELADDEDAAIGIRTVGPMAPYSFVDDVFAGAA